MASAAKIHVLCEGCKQKLSFHGATYTLIQCLSKCGQEHCVKELIRAGADVNGVQVRDKDARPMRFSSDIGIRFCSYVPRYF